jgi:hypothetical protein
MSDDLGKLTAVMAAGGSLTRVAMRYPIAFDQNRRLGEIFVSLT